MKINFDGKRYKIIYIVCLIVFIFSDLGNGYIELLILLLFIFDQDIYFFLKTKSSKIKNYFKIG